MGERAGLIAKTPEVKKENSNSRIQKTVRPRSMGTSADRIRFLQRTAGNQAVSRLMKSGALQAKLRIGQPGDVYEQEADRVADEVMRMPELRVLRQVEPEEEEEEETLQSKPLTNQITPLVQVQRQEEPEEEEEEELQAKPLAEDITPLVQRQVEPEDEEEETLQSKPLTNQITPLVQVQRQEEPEEEEEEEELQAKPLAEEITPLVQRQVEPEDEEEEELQAKATSGRISEVNSNLESHIQSFKGGGRPLSENDRTFFEPRFGRDFSQVRVHTDAHAAESARAVNARAFTVGKDVVFGEGQYASEKSEGRRLMAHELMHVIQQDAMNLNNANYLSIQRHLDIPCPVPPKEFIYARPENRWTAANLAIENAYKKAHPGKKILVGSDFPKGGTPGEGPSITVSKGKSWIREMLKGFKGLSRDLEPDIIDFTSRTIYEIKTPSRVSKGVTQLALYYKNANALLVPLGVPQFNQDFATWYPPHNLPYPSRSDRGVCTQFTTYVGPATGLIIYRIWGTPKLKRPPVPVLDPKTTLVAVMLAALLATLKLLGKPKHPAVAAAMIALALAMGVKPSFAKGKPLEEVLVEMMKSTGISVDPDIEKLIRSDPALQKKLEAIARSGKGLNEASKIIHDVLVEIKGELDKDTLRKLLYTAKAMPGGEMAGTKELIKEELRKIKAGLRPSAPGGKGGPSRLPTPKGKGFKPGKEKGKLPLTLTPASKKRIYSAPTVVQKLFIAITSSEKGPTVKDGDVDKFLKLVLPYDLEQDEVDKLIAKIVPTAPESVDILMSSLKKEIERIRLVPKTDPNAPPISPEEFKRLKKEAIGLLKLALDLKPGDIRFLYYNNKNITAGKSIPGFYAFNHKGKLIGGSCTANILEDIGKGKFKIHIPAGIRLFTRHGKYLGTSLKSVIIIMKKITMKKL